MSWLRSIDQTLLEYWNRSTLLLDYWNWLHAIAWVLIPYVSRLIERCLTIERGHKWNCLSIERDQTRRDAWVLKLITIDQTKLLEYRTRSNLRSKIAWELIPYVSWSIKRCLSIDSAIKRCLSIDAIDRVFAFAWVLIPYVSRSVKRCLSIAAPVQFELEIQKSKQRGQPHTWSQK